MIRIRITAARAMGAALIAAALAALACDGGAGDGTCRLYVDQGAAPGGDGGSWATAFASIQEGIDAAGAGCAVWVRSGTYAVFAGGADDAIALAPGVAVYGGFAGDEASPDERDLPAGASVLDGGGAVRHVVVAAAGAALDGFVVRGGNADVPADPGGRGGGVYADGVEIEIRNCAFADNAALVGGAIVADDGAAVRVVDSTFTDNDAEFGGAIFAWASALELEGCAFAGNEAVFDGGALYAAFAAPVRLARCAFEGNAAEIGGAVLNEGSALAADACAFLGNVAARDGGGVYTLDGGTTGLTNAILAWNEAHDLAYGGALFDGGGTTTAVNATFYGNTATCGGAAAAAVQGGSAALVNSLLWDPPPEGWSDDFGWETFDDLGAATVAVHRVASWEDLDGEGYDGGEVAICADPGLADPEAGDFGLTPASPCVDAADDAQAPARDFAGNARVDVDGVGTAIADLGALELVAGP